MATLQPGEKSRMYALGKIARGGAVRGGYVSGQVFITIDGVQRGFHRLGTAGVIIDSLNITDVLDETPNSCAFRLHGVAETTGGEIVITLGTANSGTRWFGGYIIDTAQIYVGDRPVNVQTDCHAVDYTWLLSFLTVTDRYTNQSATAIIQDLVAKYAAGSGFTAKHVAPSLPVLDEITFTEEDLPDAITRIMRRIGGYWYVDYDLHVHAFLDTEPNTNGAPVTLTPTHASLAHFTYDMDRSQVITRVHVEGRGSRLMAGVLVGDTMLPLETVEMFDVGSDVYLKAAFQGADGGAQYLNFTGRVTGGVGSLVGPGLGPPGAPSAAIASGTGLSVGRYTYAYTFITASGETLPSPLGVVDVGTPIPAPTAAPTLTAQVRATGVDPGAHYYAYTYVSSGGGETTSSPLQWVETTAPINPTGGIAHVNQYGTGPLQKDRYYGYKATYVGSGGGETTVAQYSWDGYYNTTLPNWKSEIFVGQGNFNPGEEYYKVPLGVTAIKLYRTKALTNFPTAATPYYFVGNMTISTDAPGTSVKGNLMDTVPDASLGALIPTANTSVARLGQVTVTTPASPDANITGVKVYRTAAYTSTPLKFVAQATGTQGAVTYLDTMTDAALGASPPILNTAGNEFRAALVTNISTGPTGVTQRKIYRTLVNAAQLKHVNGLGDNVGTQYLDQVTDAALAAAPNAPTGDTSALTMTNGQVAAGAPTMPVANTAVFQAGGGWAVIGNGEQVIRYTGKSGVLLTGIPGTGTGAITAAITFNSTITTAPMLTGIPATGSRAITTRALTAGDEVYLVVVSNDTARQSALATDLHRGTGIRETWIQDRRLSVTEARARGMATLALHPLDDLRVRYTCRDLLTRSGKTITVNLPVPTNVAGSFKIQQVQITNFRPHGEQYPTFTVDASSRQFSFEDLLRRTKVKE